MLDMDRRDPEVLTEMEPGVSFPECYKWFCREQGGVTPDPGSFPGLLSGQGFLRIKQFEKRIAIHAPVEDLPWRI
jgi:hypothetical protein